MAREYFKSKPYACDPSNLPKYPPSKEIDIKIREKASRKRSDVLSRGGPERTRKPTRRPNGMNKLSPEENLPPQKHGEVKLNGNGVNNDKGDRFLVWKPPKPSITGTKESSRVKNASQGDDTCSGPLQVSRSSGFAWAKGRMNDSSLRSRSRSSSRSLILESSGALHRKNSFDSIGENNCEVVNGDWKFSGTKHHDSCETSKPQMLKQWSQLERLDLFDTSDECHPQELTKVLYHKEEAAARRLNSVYQEQVCFHCFMTIDVQLSYPFGMNALAKSFHNKFLFPKRS